MPTSAQVSTCLHEIGEWVYGLAPSNDTTALKALYGEFNHAAAVIIRAPRTTAPGETPTAPKSRTAGSDGGRGRGRPARSTKNTNNAATPTPAPSSTRPSKTGVTTADLANYVMANPGITVGTIRAHFANLRPNVMGRMLANCKQITGSGLMKEATTQLYPVAAQQRAAA